MLSSRALDRWLKPVWRLVPLPSVWPVKRTVLTAAAFLALCVIELSELMCRCCAVAQLCLTLQRHGLQHARLPCPSPSPGIFSNSCPLSQWCHPIISSSVVPFSSCPHSFPASGSFPTSWLLTSGGQSIRASSSASVLPVNIQGWFLLGLTGLMQDPGQFHRRARSLWVETHQLHLQPGILPEWASL